MPAQLALRIVLSHKGKSFSVESVTRIEKLLQPTDSLGEIRDEQGAWVVIRDTKEKPLFRRNIRNPLGSIEVFTGEEREMRQVRVPERSGVVTFLLPILPDAKLVAFFASEPDNKDGYCSAKSVFEISTHQLLVLAREGEDKNEC